MILGISGNDQSDVLYMDELIASVRPAIALLPAAENILSQVIIKVSGSIAHFSVI